MPTTAHSGHTDQRIERTERALAAALVRLTLSRTYDEISIRDIAAEAGVGYATFFRRYPDKDALLLAVVDLVLDEMLDLLLPLAADRSAAGGRVLGTRLFRYGAEHAEVCRVLLRARHVPAIREQIARRGHAAAEHAGAVQGRGIPIEIGVHHLVSVSMSLLEWWLERGMPYSPRRMGVVYDALVLAPLRHRDVRHAHRATLTDRAHHAS
jgi:AcrR family transcriptional regulator